MRTILFTLLFTTSLAAAPVPTYLFPQVRVGDQFNYRGVTLEIRKIEQTAAGILVYHLVHADDLRPYGMWNIDTIRWAQRQKSRDDCGCTYSATPKGLLGSPCTCNPTGKDACRCGENP